MNLPRSTAVSVALLFSGGDIVHPPFRIPPIPQKHYPYLKSALQSLYIPSVDLLFACRGRAAPLKRRSNAFGRIKLSYRAEHLERSMF